ncbi:MAG: autotransporter-associated beta strand repeat-containing protein [Opitutaceae bacterium]|nr:autotransporter-associated beta strand repeat-containing protein [Opitutaceae bacterium]
MIKSPVPPAPRTRFFYGTLLLLALATGPAQAGSDTWKAAPGSADWNTAGNWVGGAIPNSATDIATFGASTETAISLSADTEVDGLTFASGASVFTITAAPSYSLTISGAGLANNSASTQNFVTDTKQDFSFGLGTISFANSATAGGNTTFTNRGSTYYNIDDTNQYSSYGGGITQFFNASQAGSATFTNQGGSATSYAGGGTTIFHDSASAGSGTFTNEGSQEVAAYGGVTVFNDTSHAGSASFTNENGPATGTRGGYTLFNDSSDARDGTFTSNGGVDSGTMGVTMFNHGTNAGSAHLIANGGVASGGSGGYVIFNDTASAASGVFTVSGGTINGTEGGNVQFWAGTTADNASFSINGGTVDGAGAGFVYFTNYVAGYGSTSTPATAGTGAFITHGGGAVNASGGYIGFENATADHGTFTTNGGTASGAGAGKIMFSSFGGGEATADHGNFTLNGGTASGAQGAYIAFNQTSTAANSTLIANGGTNGGDGASIRFFDAALGGNAIVKVYGNGNLDISPENIYMGSVTVSIASLEGSGNVFLGNNNLTVGGNNASTAFSGVFQDSGYYGSGGNGSLTKVGNGTLTLTGASTHTGTTNISAGTVLINNSSGSVFGGSAVTVSPGATLAGGGSFTGDLQLDGILSPGNSPGALSAGDTTFGGGGNFIWEINSVNGTAGADPGWDTLSVGGTLTLTATSGTPFTVFLTSLTAGNTAGEVFDFNPSANYAFTLATTTSGIIGFDADAFELNFDGFENSFSGSWSVEQSGGDLNLIYAAAVPEPSTYAAMAGAVMLGFVFWRRRRQPAPARS